MEYTTVKIPKSTYESARLLQAEIARNGINNLPEDVKRIAQSTSCPLCGSEMNPVQGSNVHQCPKCGFSKQTFDLSPSNPNPDDALRALAVAGLIVLGIALLAGFLGAASMVASGVQLPQTTRGGS